MSYKALPYIALAIIFGLLLSSCKREVAADFDDAPHGTISIAHLKTLSADASTSITADIAIEGYIIANDLYGELYKSIVISDQSGGIEISVDCPRTALQFPIGARIIVHCTSLAIGDYGGSLILGAQPTGEYVVDRISEQLFARHFTIDRDNPMMIEPLRLTIDQIGPQHIGNFVTIDDLDFGDKATEKWCDTDPETGEFITTERMAFDSAGNSIAVRIEGRCSYAGEAIPSGRGSIGAIAEYFNGAYSLRIINRNIHF